MNNRSLKLVMITCLAWLAGTFLPALAVQPGEQQVRIGVRAHQGNNYALQQWQPTADYLTTTLPGYRFQFIPYNRLPHLQQAAADRQFDFVLTNPSSFVEMNHRYQVRSLLTLLNRRHNTAQSRFGSVIFTHVENTGILTLEDLWGKNLMAVSETAFGGWQVAWRELLRHGIDPYLDLGRLSFGAGNQHNVVYAVRDKKVQAGVVRTDMLERMAAAGLIDLRRFRVLNPQETRNFPFFHSTPLYPEWTLAALAHVPPQLQEKVRHALLALPADHEAAGHGQYVGWIESLDYEPVRELMRELAVAPYEVEKKTPKNPRLLVAWLILLVLFILIVILKIRAGK